MEDDGDWLGLGGDHDLEAEECQDSRRQAALSEYKTDRETRDARCQTRRVPGERFYMPHRGARFTVSLRVRA